MKLKLAEIKALPRSVIYEGPGGALKYGKSDFCKPGSLVLEIAPATRTEYCFKSRKMVSEYENDTETIFVPLSRIFQF